MANAQTESGVDIQDLGDESFWQQYQQANPINTMPVSIPTPTVAPGQFMPAPGSNPITPVMTPQGPVAPGSPAATLFANTGTSQQAPFPGVPAGVYGNMQAFGQAWLASGGKTNQDLANFVKAHPEYGVTIGGSKANKIYGPGGQYWAQATQSGGLGGVAGIWDTSTGSPTSTGGGSLGSLAGLASGQFTTPIAQFTPPTAQDAMNSPGVQFSLDEAHRLNENNAAALGVLGNGRRQQALQASDLSNAATQYQNVYGNAANTFGINYGVQTGNEDRPFQKYYSLAQLGQQAAGNS